MKTYYVFGDYGYNSEKLLLETTDLKEAKKFVNEEYRDEEDMGGFNVVEVIWFMEDGEMVTEDILRAEDLEPEYDYYSD